jgi:hypothetical protein
MNSEKSPKLKLAEKIKSVGNILITVSRNPSVDELSAALGLTFLLDKMDKHATAVFSGDIPPAINFLEPEKTFENNADSLRDFIISLDKEKADRLRYKVEGDLVKVFITPYKTKITADDLKFEEGDFNVELVIAIGAENRDDLDAAIAAHGRILHDAILATLLISGAQTNLGTIIWQDNAAGSYAEMVADLAKDLDSKDKTMIDEPIATALLTGVVAATDQFRNDKTSPAVMTLAADLMAKGANQQLIASELSAVADENDDQEAIREKKSNSAKPAATEPEKANGEMEIGHGEPEEPAPAAETNSRTSMIDSQVTATNEQIQSERSGDALAAAEAQLNAAQNQPPAESVTSTPTVEPTLPPPPVVEQAPTPAPTIDTVPQPSPTFTQIPAPTPVATTEIVEPSPAVAESPNDAATAATAQLDNLVQQNGAATSTLDDLRAAVNNAGASNDANLSHGMPYVESAAASPLNAALINDEPASIDPFATPSLPADANSTIQPPAQTMPQPTPAEPLAPPVFAQTAQPTNDSALPLPPPLPQTEPIAPIAPAPEPAPVASLPASPMFPPVDTGASDPTQYRIPS